MKLIEAFNCGGDDDALIHRIDPEGAVLEHSTCLGGSTPDEARGVAVDATRAIDVAGRNFFQ